MGIRREVLKLIWRLFLWVMIVFPAEAKIKAVDGDSLVWGDLRIRLLGLDAPEYRQTCGDKDGNDYPCGLEALNYLKGLVNSGRVKCRRIKKDIYGRDLSICHVNGKDINREMIASGWAVAYRTKKEKYLAAEREAKRKYRGMWQGKFMKPELYRILTK